MDMANTGTTNNTTDGLMRAQMLLWSHVYNYVSSLSLKCAVELGIPRAIHDHEGPVTVPQLLSSLSIPSSKAPQMRRLMRMLAHFGIFIAQSNNNFDDDEVVYTLTPLSSLLVENVDLNLNKSLLLALHPFFVVPFQSMSAWFKITDDEPTPFSLTHGIDFWEMTRRDPNFSKLFNEGMASDTELVMHVLVKDCGRVFDGITSLIDVGGGTGSAARAIMEAFPKVKCSVLELPQVVNGVKSSIGIGRKVEFICGDMFECIPPADAVLLKWILHDWSDEDCVRILKRCKESIKEDGGKVIIIDEVIDSNNYYERSRDAQLYFDVLMMVLCGGAVRNEKEWRKIFIEAGFKHCEITPALGVHSVIELYP